MTFSCVSYRENPTPPGKIVGRHANGGKETEGRANVCHVDNKISHRIVLSQIWQAKVGHKQPPFFTAIPTGSVVSLFACPRAGARVYVCLTVATSTMTSNERSFCHRVCAVCAKPKLSQSLPGHMVFLFRHSRRSLTMKHSFDIRRFRKGGRLLPLPLLTSRHQGEGFKFPH